MLNGCADTHIAAMGTSLWNPWIMGLGAECFMCLRDDVQSLWPSAAGYHQEQPVSSLLVGNAFFMCLWCPLTCTSGPNVHIMSVILSTAYPERVVGGLVSIPANIGRETRPSSRLPTARGRQNTRREPRQIFLLWGDSGNLHTTVPLQKCCC